MTEGGALGAMTGFNRIGCQYAATCQSLLTTVLRDEWGFKGHVTTDAFTASSLYKTHYLEELVAGIDYTCWDSSNIVAAVKEAIDGGDGYILRCLRESAKRNVYAASRTVSVNGLSSNSVVVTIVPWWQTTLVAAAGVLTLGSAACLVLYLVFAVQDKKRKV